MTIRAPSREEGAALHRAFRAAFSDYLVAGLGNISRAAFEAMLASRGWVPEASRVEVGASGDIVAFWLTGLEAQAGVLRAYDIATGVVPGHRRRGASTRLWRELQLEFAERGVASCQLEVVVDNTKAVDLYRALGFEVRRRLDCYRTPAGGLDGHLKADAAPGSIEVTEGDQPPATGLCDWWSWTPSWQHTHAALVRAGADVGWLAAHAEGELVGYAALLHQAKDLAQLAVAPAHRRRGIGRHLLRAALRQEPQLRVLNVDADDRATRGLLCAFELERFAVQFEMRIELAR